MPYGPLKQELNRLTSRIWWDVTTVRSARGPMQLGEVSVTERLHLDLLHSGLLTGLVIYNVPDEVATGADWEWYVQIPGSKEYLHYRIQAKILKAVAPGKPSRLSFDQIDYRPRPSVSQPNPPSQRTTLIARARQAGAVPYYAFYVGNPWPQAAPIQLPPWTAAQQVPEEQFGCTSVPAHVVDHIYQGSGKKSEANQYVSDPSGRRLSDLFPSVQRRGSHQGPSGGDGPAGGVPTEGASPDPNVDLARELTLDEASELDELRDEGERNGLPLLVRETMADANHRMTAFFTLEAGHGLGATNTGTAREHQRAEQGDAWLWGN